MRWFVAKRGLVSTLRICSSCVLLMFPALIRPTLEQVGWRATLSGCGAATLVVGGLAASLLRDSPEDMGLLPDGRPPTATEFRKPSKPDEHGDDGPGDGDGNIESGGRGIDGECAALPPASVGRPPGGRKNKQQAGLSAADHHLGEPDWTFSEVLRCRFLWVYVAATVAQDIFWS